MCVPAADPRWAKTFFQPTELAFAGLEFICLSIVCLLIALTARRNRGPPVQLGNVPKEVVNKEKVWSPRSAGTPLAIAVTAPDAHHSLTRWRSHFVAATRLRVGPLAPRHPPAPGED